MARSLGLTAYQALARRGEPPETPQRRLRPVGELVWIHAAEPDNQELQQRTAAASLSKNEYGRYLSLLLEFESSPPIRP